MPFDNFYEESDKSRCRWWKIFGLAFLLVTGYSVFALFNPSYRTRENVAPVFPVPAKERKERVHELCDSLPVPEAFQFVGKTNTTDVAAFSSVGYIYKSARSTDEIYPTFIVWFGENGWSTAKTFDNGLQFTKNVQTVQIAPYAPFATKPFDYFMVICTEGRYD